MMTSIFFNPHLKKKTKSTFRRKNLPSSTVVVKNVHRNKITSISYHFSLILCRHVITKCQQWSINHSNDKVAKTLTKTRHISVSEQ